MFLTRRTRSKKLMVSHYSHNTFILVRHGEAQNTVKDIVSSERGMRRYHLTERGRKQAAQTARFLSSFHPDFIVASSVLRAIETAEIIRDQLDIPLSFDVRLGESRLGDFEESDRQSFFDFMQAHGGRTAGAPERGVEGYVDIRERAKSFLGMVSENFSGEKVVVVSHADILQEIYGELMGVPVGPSQHSRFSWSPKLAACRVLDGEKMEEFIPKS